MCLSPVHVSVTSACERFKRHAVGVSPHKRLWREVYGHDCLANNEYKHDVLWQNDTLNTSDAKEHKDCGRGILP